MGPLLILLALGVFEAGFAFREVQNNAAALRGGARQVSNLGNDRTADYYGLQTITNAMVSAKNITVNRVVIYRATGADGSPANAACLTTAPSPTGAGFAGDCNIYGPAQLAALGSTPPSANFGTSGSSCSATAWDTDWCPLSRHNLQSDPPDFVGVYMNVTYKSYTSLFPTTVTLSDRTVYQISPKVS